MKGWFKHWRTALDLVVLPISAALGIIAIALGEVADQNGRAVLLPWHPNRAPVLIIGFILTLFGVLVGAIRNRVNTIRARRFNDLEMALTSARQALKELSRVELADLSERLRYLTNERISLFIPARDNSYLRLGARYSITNEFMAPGRATYPTDQGCLGRAWLNSEASVLDLPDPQSQYQAWKDRLRVDWGIPDDVSGNFRMRSRTCIAFGIYPPLKPCQGVIVFESQELPSTQPDAPLLDPERLRERIRRSHRDKLIRLVEVLEKFED